MEVKRANCFVCAQRPEHKNRSYGNIHEESDSFNEKNFEKIEKITHVQRIVLVTKPLLK
jgi:hypothetical protein